MRSPGLASPGVASVGPTSGGEKLVINNLNLDLKGMISSHDTSNYNTNLNSERMNRGLDSPKNIPSKDKFK